MTPCMGAVSVRKVMHFPVCMAIRRVHDRVHGSTHVLGVNARSRVHPFSLCVTGGDRREGA